jgi:hypothetical protein
VKKLLLLCATLIWPHVAMAAAEAPFAPLPNVPDYVATIFVKLGHGPTHRDIRTHRAGWTRVDGSFDQRYYRSTAYFGPGSLFVVFAREPSAKVEHSDYLYIVRGPANDRGSGRSGDPFKTSERQMFLGESCEIWNKSKGFIPAAKALSCVTPDGIELWSRVENDILPGTSTEVTALKRQPVAPDEVRPPGDRFDLKSWLGVVNNGAQPSSPLSDATVIMQSEDKLANSRQAHTRTMRRHFPWTYTEDQLGDGRRVLRFRNEIAQLDITFESNSAGEPASLTINKLLYNPGVTPLPKSDQTETILGEQCFRSENRGRHERSRQCRTDDGLLLKDSSSGMEGSYALVAVKLDRGPVSLDAVLPPPFIFARATWGIPD